MCAAISLLSGLFLASYLRLLTSYSFFHCISGKMLKIHSNEKYVIDKM